MVEKMSSVVPVKKSVVAVQKPVAVVEQIDVGEEKSMWWLWVIIALVVIGVLALTWWLV